MQLAKPDPVLPREANGDLELKINDSGDTMTVTGWYKEPTSRIEQIVFGDGTTLDETYLASLTVPPITGTEGNDTLEGDGTLLGYTTAGFWWESIQRAANKSSMIK